MSFALVSAGCFDGKQFRRPKNYQDTFYKELRPISDSFQPAALRVNGLDRDKLKVEGELPERAMEDAFQWVKRIAGNGRPVLVAYPLSFDWAWLYWYFTRFCPEGSPFGHSRCFDIKTAIAVKARIPTSEAGRQQLFGFLRSGREHTHHALDDAVEQAEIFANVFEWEGVSGRNP